MITVVNKYKEPNCIYCGRGTALGNPFKMHGESDRDNVCDLYENWFHQQLQTENTAFHTQINNILINAGNNDINLGCFCAPKRCHCDTIKNYIDDLILRIAHSNKAVQPDLGE